MTYPRVSDILAAAGLAADFSHVNAEILEAAQARGTAVHEAITAHHYGYEVDITPEIKPYLAAYERFLSESGHEPIVSEYELVDSEWGVMGHVDRVGYLNKLRGIFDWTIGDGQSKRYQLAAYRWLWNRCRPQEPVTFTAGVELRANGTYRLYETEGAQDEQVWLAAVIVYQAQQR